MENNTDHEPQYADDTAPHDQPVEDSIPLEQFDDAAPGLSTSISDGNTSFAIDSDDDPDSEQVKHKVTLNPHKFRLALGLWAEDVGISRPHWSSLLEILRMYGLGPKLAEEVAKLPSSLSTLKQQTKAQLPLLTMRKKAIPLIPEETNKVSEPVSREPTFL